MEIIVVLGFLFFLYIATKEGDIDSDKVTQNNGKKDNIYKKINKLKGQIEDLDITKSEHYDNIDELENEMNADLSKSGKNENKIRRLKRIIGKNDEKLLDKRGEIMSLEQEYNSLI